MLRHSVRSSTTSSDHPRRCGGQTRCPACISAPPAKTGRSAFGNCRQTEACRSLPRFRVKSGRWGRYGCVLGLASDTAFVFGRLSYAPAVQNGEKSPEDAASIQNPPENAACVQNLPENTQRIRMSPENIRHLYNCLSPDNACRPTTLVVCIKNPWWEAVVNSSPPGTLKTYILTTCARGHSFSKPFSTAAQRREQHQETSGPARSVSRLRPS